MCEVRMKQISKLEIDIETIKTTISSSVQKLVMEEKARYKHKKTELKTRYEAQIKELETQLYNYV